MTLIFTRQLKFTAYPEFRNLLKSSYFILPSPKLFYTTIIKQSDLDDDTPYIWNKEWKFALLPERILSNGQAVNIHSVMCCFCVASICSACMNAVWRANVLCGVHVLREACDMFLCCMRER
ncbi:hypothetical protein DINM_001103 [Dirofilaria immitis]|nr:hypothetical protein [Dirofilaria immitis]